MMITSNIYNELIKFRDAPQETLNGPTPEIKYLTEQGFIRATRNTVHPNLSIRPVAWEITVAGKNALSEYEDYLKKSAEEKAEKKRQRWFDVVLLVLGAALGQLLEYAFQLF